MRARSPANKCKEALSFSPNPEASTSLMQFSGAAYPFRPSLASWMLGFVTGSNQGKNVLMDLYQDLHIHLFRQQSPALFIENA